MKKISYSIIIEIYLEFEIKIFVAIKENQINDKCISSKSK